MDPYIIYCLSGVTRGLVHLPLGDVGGVQSSQQMCTDASSQQILENSVDRSKFGPFHHF